MNDYHFGIARNFFSILIGRTFISFLDIGRLSDVGRPEFRRPTSAKDVRRPNSGFFSSILIALKGSLFFSYSFYSENIFQTLSVLVYHRYEFKNLSPGVII